MIGRTKIIPKIKNTWLWYVIFFLSYILSGHLLSTISFQSQVVSIWLPAGIALIGCYLWWWRFFPAVFFASFIFNFSIIPNFESSLIFSLVGVQNAIIATGSMLQAIVGASLLRYWLGNPLEQWNNSKTIYFVLIVGILTNLISSNIGVYSLSIFNPSYHLEEFQLNMIYWWLGDSLGVLFIAPFIFSLLHFKHLKIHQRKARITILSSVIILFTVTVLITQFFVTKLSIDSQKLVIKETKIIENGIHRQINGGINQLRDLAIFIQNTPSVNKESFHKHVSSIYENSPAIKAMSWNPIISQQQKLSHENGLMQIHSNNASIKGKPLLINDPIIYVKFISPEKGNEKAIGFNVYSNPSRKQTLKSAIESYQPKATPIIQLVQSDKKEPAFLLFYPVFEQYNDEKNINNKRLKGFATAVFLAEKMLINAFTKQQQKLFYYEVFEQGKQQWFLTNTEHTESAALTLLDDSEHFTDTFSVAGQKWNFNLLVNKEFLVHKQIKEFLVLYIFLVVIVITIITSLLMMNNRQLALDNLVNQRTESLKIAVQDANHANKAKSQFLANMSHEIRTPMNSVVGFARLAQDSTDVKEIKSFLDKISISSDLLLHIVNDILDISKIESSKLILNKDVFDLHIVLKRIYSIFEVQASVKNLSWHLNDNLPEQMFINGDQTRIEQILMNLCGNAMKFTQHGSVTLTAELLNQFDNKSHIKIQVKDTGIGILEKNIANLFDPFTQADASTSRDFGGTGLGLTISKKLSQLMAGDIKISSVKGQGSIFTFTCHLSIANPPSTQITSKIKRVKMCQENMSKLKVLVAEDNRINQILIDTILKKLGIDATIVENGQLAIDHIKQEHVDVVLMDCQMPVLDGYQATKIIRSFPEFSNLAIFALTADVDTRSKERAMSIGFDKHLAKPIDVVELTESLQSVLEQTELQEAAVN